LRAQVLRGGAWSFAVKIVATILALLVSVVLARFLGPEGFGVYSYVLALVSMMAIPVQLGLPELVVRETAKAHLYNKWNELWGIWRWSLIAVSVFSAILFAVALMLTIFVFGGFSGLQLNTYFWGLILVPLFALTRLYGSMLQGLRKVIYGQLPDVIIRPGIFIILVSIWLLINHGKNVSPSQVMALHACSALVTLVFAAWLVKQLRPTEMHKSVDPIYHTKQWISSVMPLAFISGMGIINTQTDLIMLGFIMTPSDVGIYRVAVQGATFVSFGLSAIAMVAMPYYAQFHAKGEKARLQRLATISARAMLAVAIPTAILFFIWGEPILRLVFGEEYVSAYSALVILSIANIFHAGFGILGPLLNMAGYEKVTAKGIAFAALCNVVLNFIFIPIYGVVGAALATGASLIVWNVVLWWAVIKNIGIDPSALNMTLGKR